MSRGTTCRGSVNNSFARHPASLRTHPRNRRPTAAVKPRDGTRGSEPTAQPAPWCIMRGDEAGGTLAGREGPLPLRRSALCSYSRYRSLHPAAPHAAGPPWCRAPCPALLHRFGPTTVVETGHDILFLTSSSPRPLPCLAPQVLPDDRDGDWARHPLLLGGAHDHDGPSIHRAAAIQDRLPPWPGALAAVQPYP